MSDAGASGLMVCHCCGQHHAGVSVSEPAAGPRLPHFTVDMHCHLLVPAVEECVAGHPHKQAETAQQARLMGAASLAHNQQMRAAIGPRLTTPAVRVADMDRLGIDLQVLSPSPTQYYTWADAGLARDVVRLQNEAIAGVVRAQPDRFEGLGAVALQHPELAAEQLREAVSTLGLRGAEITSDPTGKGLDDPALDVFWREAQRLDAVIFLHPLGTSLGERVNRYYLSNVIGQPLETTIALSELIHGGVLDRFTRLRICAAHGGGYLPFAPGRSDHGFGVRPEARGCARSPGEYLQRMWFDSVVFRPESLRVLIDTVGLGQVVAGTDYPFDMGEYALHELIRRVPGLASAGQAALLGGNASALLRLDAHHPARLRADLTPEDIR
ncbi:MAG: amidohydrolase [Burkholderiales bacterium]|nr:amidohydrolase [Burkholderiales bacterium]